MKTPYLPIMVALFMGGSALAQKPAANPSRPAQTTPQKTRPAAFDLYSYGVQIKSEPRLIVMMAALDAAGFDPTPAGRKPSAFRAQIRKDGASLDPELRRRMRDFYERRKLPEPATPADQAARYVSLAFALGGPPAFDAPVDTEGLPVGVLDVMDFAPLLREFYRKSGIDDRLPVYVRAYDAEGARLIKGDSFHRPISEMVRSVLSYLHTQPSVVTFERVPVKSPADAKKKKNAPQAYTVRERDRRFFIVPDKLAAPGAINFRVIADDYYALVPEGTDPGSSELRRTYLQYVIDPLVVRFSRDIAGRRPAIRQLLDERSKAGATVSPDVFLVVSRSLVAAADARLDESTRLNALTVETRTKLAQAKTVAERSALAKELQDGRAAIADEEIAQLADAYEGGAVLAFYFADQLRGLESSGFDIANFFVDMIAAIDPVRESKRPAEYREARERAVTARRARLARASVAGANEVNEESADPESTRSAALVKNLVEVDEMLQSKDYASAESRLRALLQEFKGEPRIFYALAETANLSARDAVDEDVQSSRLNNALTNYRMAINASSADTDAALLSRSHEAMGTILAFLGRADEARNEFDAAIKLGNVQGGAYNAAVVGKNKLGQK
jgi:hypothetical protein